MRSEHAHRDALQGEAVGGQREELARGPARAQGGARVKEGQEDRDGRDQELVDGDGEPRRRHTAPGPVTAAP